MYRLGLLTIIGSAIPFLMYRLGLGSAIPFLMYRLGLLTIIGSAIPFLMYRLGLGSAIQTWATYYNRFSSTDLGYLL